MPIRATASVPDTTSAQGVTGQTIAAQIRRKVAIFVEPSPFSHVSGMKNRFECLIQGLRGRLLPSILVQKRHFELERAIVPQSLAMMSRL